jgi:hypothetical protein
MRRVCVVVLIAACGDGVTTAPEANPLGSTDDILPFPSSLFERADAASPTGVVLDVPGAALPRPDTGVVIDTDGHGINARTGWSVAVTMLWATPRGVDPATLVGDADFAASLAPDSSTVVLDMTTGERVAHFAEVDANELDHFDRQAVYLRPAQRLAGGHRYAVAIRKAVKARDGSAIARTAGFQAVLDNSDVGHTRLDRARPRLRAAIAALETAGVKRDELVVAWDFTVEDDLAAIADPLAARDSALAAMGPLGVNLAYTVTADQGTINADPRIARRIDLDFQAPRVAGDHNDGFVRVDGLPAAQGTMTAHAFLLVPPCATAANKAGILIYGHGFFGSLDELRNNEYLRDLSEDGCYVVAGTLWTGMSMDDISDALLGLNDLDRGFGFGEHVFQGVVNFIALEQLMRGKLATEVLVDGSSRSIVDPARTVFLGISMGHILGSTFFAYDPAITRGVIHVGGANWALMFERSKNWSVYGAPIKGSYGNLLDAVIIEQVLEMALEHVDGATVAGVAIPGTPAKQVLMHTSLGDCEVPNLAGFYQARSLGLTLITPSVMTPFGFETAQATTSDHAYVIVDEHPTPLPPTTNEVYAYDNVAHENPRRRVLLHQQMRDFWTTGTVTNACTGACDCTAGNCGALHPPMYGGH